MTAQAAAAGAPSIDVPVPAPTPVPLGDSARWRILLYASILIFMLGFGGPYLGLIDVPISFFLKNKLHLTASEVARFRAWSAAPLYVSFLFGFARDRWNPFGMKDRGFMVLFGSITALIYLTFAFIPVGYLTLLIGVILLTVAYLFVISAQNGLVSTIGQQHVMSGQISTILNTVASLPILVAFMLGGVLSDALEGQNADRAARILFLIGAAVMATIAVYGAWRPRVVFDNVHSESGPTIHPLADLKRLAGHWPIYPALLVWLLWNFAPGSVTPLQYYLQNTLHARDAQWGEWNAIFAGSFIPTFMLYGVLCRKFPLRKLLLWGTVVAVPQMVPLAFIHSVNGALAGAAFMGLTGGVASAAYIDLIIRSCPRGLQGTTVMMSTGLYWIASRFGDILGTGLYDHYKSFAVCVIAITVVYAMILPALLLVPRRLTATADGAIPEGGFD